MFLYQHDVNNIVIHTETCVLGSLSAKCAAFPTIEKNIIHKVF
jgi:hypothetical protein